MPAPTASDGLSRAVTEMAVPSVGVYFIVILTKEFVGEITAGIVYILLTTIIVTGIVISAKWWNLRYLGSFLPAALVLFIMMPDIIVEIIHPIWSVLGSLVTLMGLFVLGIILAQKLGLDELR